jgi:hypothetical protein
VGKNWWCPRLRSAAPCCSWPRSLPSGSAFAAAELCVPRNSLPQRTARHSPCSWQRWTPPSPPGGVAPRVALRAPRTGLRSLRRRPRPGAKSRVPSSSGQWTSTKPPPPNSIGCQGLVRVSRVALWPTATRQAHSARLRGCNGSAGLAPRWPPSCRHTSNSLDAPHRGGRKWGAVTNYCMPPILDTCVICRTPSPQPRVSCCSGEFPRADVRHVPAPHE